MNFVIRNQLDRSIIPCHANDIEKAQIGNWQMPKVNEGHSIRKAHYAVAPETSSSSDSQDGIPLARLAKLIRHEKENSKIEDPIPKIELAKYQNAERNFTTDLDSMSSSDATEFYDCQNGSVQSEKGDKIRNRYNQVPHLTHIGKRQTHN